MNEILKPCPFCGGEAEFVKTNNNTEVYIRCTKTNCFAATNRHFANVDSAVINEAIKEWNNRME